MGGWPGRTHRCAGIGVVSVIFLDTAAFWSLAILRGAREYANGGNTHAAVTTHPYTRRRLLYTFFTHVYARDSRSIGMSGLIYWRPPLALDARFLAWPGASPRPLADSSHSNFRLSIIILMLCRLH